MQTVLQPQQTAWKLLQASPCLQPVLNVIRRAAPTDVPVLIVGESGTGKELAAKALHELSLRSNGPFLGLNLAAIPVELAESALFGHDKGAFTGAIRATLGLCRAADRGTLFLDEITEAPLPLQAKLLRFLQNCEVQQLGSDEVVQIDVRMVAATNRNPEDAIREHVFREDLFHRLNVVQVRMPPLRERRQDLTRLIDGFLEEFSAKYERPRTITQGARECLKAFHWPGNVRQLRAVIESLVVLSESDAIGIQDLPREILTRPTTAVEPVLSCGAPDTNLEQFKRRVIVDTLEQTGDNISEAARRLGIGRSTLYRQLKLHAAHHAIRHPRRANN